MSKRIVLILTAALLTLSATACDWISWPTSHW
jgi:hypothetical protein